MSRVVASIEARMASSRLPGKVLHDINGKPTIERVVDRLRRCEHLDDIVVATTDQQSDDVLAQWCDNNGVAVYRGSEDDVLARVVEAQEFMGSSIVVEITGDCPLTDPKVVDQGVELFHTGDYDVVTNCGTLLTWPMGVCVQVFPLELLSNLAATVADPAVREHVSLYFYEHPDRFHTHNMVAPSHLSKPDLRFQLDYPQDLTFIREVFRALEPDCGGEFGVEKVVALLDRRPELIRINRDCVERSARN